MTPLFKKLNFKNQDSILIVNPPESFLTEMEGMKDFCRMETDPGKLNESGFILAFVTKQTDVNSLTPILVGKLKENGVFWFAYPKQSSKKYKCDFNRDNGWMLLQSMGFGGVRMVAIDEDWSALRFRPGAAIR